MLIHYRLATSSTDRRKVSIPKEKPKIAETRQFKNFNTNNFQQGLRQTFGSVHLHGA